MDKDRSYIGIRLHIFRSLNGEKIVELKDPVYKKTLYVERDGWIWFKTGDIWEKTDFSINQMFDKYSFDDNYDYRIHQMVVAALSITIAE